MISTFVPVWVTLSALCALGYGALWWLGRRTTPDRRLTRMVLGSYVIRVALALALYAVAAWDVPFLQSYHTSDGFWNFGPDASVSHLFGMQFMRAWTIGTELFHPWVAVEYVTWIAACYYVFGIHPLFPILLGCALAAVTGILAYSMAEQLFDRQAGIRAACLVSFWPSTFIWSAQLLKDSLGVFLLFVVLYLVLAWLPSPLVRGRHPWRTAAQAVMLVIATVTMTCFRFYLGSLLAITVFLIGGMAAGYELLRRRYGRSVRYVSLVCVIVPSVLFARTMNTFQLVSPRHPEIGHFVLAARHWERGELQLAAREHVNALKLYAVDPDRYLSLVEQGVSRGDPQEALAVYTELLVYLRHERPGTIHKHDAPLRRTIARVRMQIGDQLLQQGRFTEAISAYRRAFRSDHTVPGAQERCGVALRQRTLARQHQAVIASKAPIPPQPPNAKRASPAAAPVVIPATGASPLPIRDKAATIAASPAPETIAHLRRALHHAYRVAAVPAEVTASEASASSVEDAAAHVAGQLSPESLAVLRAGFVQDAGHSSMDVTASIRTPRQLFAYLPRAILIGFFAPFPWHWFDAGGSTGRMRLLAGCEIALFYLLIPAVIGGARRLWRQRSVGGLFVLLFSLLLAVGLSLVVANLGILFRLRLQFLLPLLVVGAGYPVLSAYRKMGRWFRVIR